MLFMNGQCCPTVRYEYNNKILDDIRLFYSFCQSCETFNVESGFHEKMLKFYLSLLLAIVNIKNVITKNHSIIVGNVKVTATYGNFKRHHKVTITLGEIIGYSVTSRKECGRACIQHVHCNGFTLTRQFHSSPLSCRLFKGNLNINHYYVKETNDEDFYEMQNLCTLNPGICEHGSVCIPHFHNNSYFCDWCQQPFYGKHCNETEAVEVEYAGPDITSGKNSSCRQLLHNYGNIDGFNDIHPWKDWRKIRVFCYPGGQMALINYAYHSGLHHHTNLTAGIQLTGLHTVGTSFVNSLYKLIRFRHITWMCKDPSTSNKINPVTSYDSENHLNVFKYMIGESDIVPSACDIAGNVDCNLLVTKKFSAPNVPFQKRLYQDVLQYVNGDMLTLNGDLFGCFQEPRATAAGDSLVINIK